MNYLFMKRGVSPLFIFFLFQHSTFFLQAQEIRKLEKDVDMIFSKSHYAFTIIPFIDQKASITKNIERYSVHATTMHGFEAGFSRYSHFDKEQSIIVGIFFGAFGRNLNYAIPGNEFNPPEQGYITVNNALSREFNFVAGVPIVFEKRWFMKSKKFLNGKIGLTMRYTPKIEDSLSDIWTGNYKFFELDVVTNPKKSLWFNYNIGGGVNWILKNNNIFKICLELNLSFTSFAKGSYQFTLPNQPVVEGNYEVKGSYIGLSFSYVFTRANNK